MTERLKKGWEVNMLGASDGGVINPQQGDKLVNQPRASFLPGGGSWAPLSPGREDNEDTQPASGGL